MNAAQWAPNPGGPGGTDGPDRVFTWLQRNTPPVLSCPTWCDHPPAHHRANLGELGARPHEHLAPMWWPTPQVKVGGRTTTGIRVADLRKRLAEIATNLTNLGEDELFPELGGLESRLVNANRVEARQPTDRASGCPP